ncbi:MAG TPA: hypothetical protein VFH34_13735 [Anaerolineales bacterium]|nr:hypothetical protein [Anaerolineales bacterium]
MLTHLRLFRIVSTIGMITALFSSLPFTPASAQKKFDATSSFLSTTWYVANTGNDANSCLAADSPCETINGALAKVAPEDTIKVAIGTYTGTGTEVVQIDKNITISGGWNAAFTAQDGRSIIDGQEIRNGIYVNAAPYVVIDRFTIRNGGLGVHNFSGALTLNNSLVTGNVGGGVDNYGIMTINNTLITENIAYSDCCSGGG